MDAEPAHDDDPTHAWPIVLDDEWSPTDHARVVEAIAAAQADAECRRRSARKTRS